MSRIGFVCFKCSGTTLEEVMTGVTVSTTITSVGDQGDVEYGEATNENGEVSHYQCLDCGYILPVYPRPGEPMVNSLFQWLKNNAHHSR